MDIKVGDHIGMTVDADALHFGIVMVTGCSTRSIIITHKYDYPIKAIIGIVGELESWTSIKENDFILNKNEEKEVEFKVCAPKDATRDTSYTSTARIVLKRV
ncbi:hypothetical protein KY361_05685 [Candidatus Woesearchaeota archaeon]|nr:hypothetical protein [Candidatus Woesearchaeota archaeon]